MYRFPVHPWHDGCGGLAARALDSRPPARVAELVRRGGLKSCCPSRGMWVRSPPRALVLASVAVHAPRLLIPALLLAAALAAGCGSSSTSTTSSAPSSSPAPAASTSTPAPSTPVRVRPKPKVVPPKGPAPKKLVIKDLAVGKGRGAAPGDTLQVNYVGVLYKNGKEFDSSFSHGMPFSFVLQANQVIKGWDQGLLGMRPGGRRELIIPARLAYGSQGQGGIPPNSPLVFVIDLLKAT